MTSELYNSILDPRRIPTRKPRIPPPPPPIGRVAVDLPEVQESHEAEPRPSGTHAIVQRRTRLLSLLALVAVLVGLLQLGRAAFHAVRDSLVAPIVLSPDSDLVLPSKLTLSRMITERNDLEVRLQYAEGNLKADEQAIERLTELKVAVLSGLGWADDVTAEAQSSNSRKLQLIAEQKQLIARSIAAQQAYVDELKKSLAAGLVHRTDVLREEAELSRVRLSALQMERERLAGKSELHANELAQAALHHGGRKGRVLSPDVLQNSDHVARIELELLKLETDRRARTSEIRSLSEQRTKSDELIAQVKARPVFRAVEAEQNLAFVPYTQISGVRAGSVLYDCALWSVFFCERVGEVAALLPGEVSMQDPWGTPARGQYALLHLRAAEAARSRVLHVREPDATVADAHALSTVAVVR